MTKQQLLSEMAAGAEILSAADGGHRLSTTGRIVNVPAMQSLMRAGLIEKAAYVFPGYNYQITDAGRQAAN